MDDALDDLNDLPTARLRAFVLAGGLGLRLRSVVKDVPKVLAPVAGRPFLEHVLRQLQAGGVRRVTICTGYGAATVVDFCGNGARWGLEVSYSEETSPLGTAGALAQAWQGLDDEQFLVLNGDSYFEVPLEDLVAKHRVARATASIAVRSSREAGRFGAVEVDADGMVTEFREKSTTAGAFVNGGIYVLQQAALEGIRPGEHASLEHDVFPALTDARSRPDARSGLLAVVYDGIFIDIGVPADYLRASQVLASLPGAEGESV